MEKDYLKILLIMTVLIDGSYLLIDDHETIYGECYLIKDGHIQLICHENETIRLDNLKL